MSTTALPFPAEDVTSWWWPDDTPGYYWPPGVKKGFAPVDFQRAFEVIGYTHCDSELLELGFQKIAVYATAEGIAKHACRQLENGRWTSKLGRWEDIEHSLHDLAGEVYGSVALIMKRPSRS